MAMGKELPVNLSENVDEDKPTLAEILQDFHPGPLDKYRKKASFDWKRLKVLLEGEDILRFKVLYNAWKEIRDNI